MIITIDGPVATGKSTIAKKLAEELKFIYFDTGAMYRTLTFALMQNNIDLKNEESLRQFLSGFHFDIQMIDGQKHYIWNQTDVTQAIRTPEVTALVSEVAAFPDVRHRLVEVQRTWSKGVDAVFEGRDLGTVVFPHAFMKVFLTGRDDVRAKRRFDELCAKFPDKKSTFSLSQVLEDLKQRDFHDSTREHSPLKQPVDALVIDTSDLTVDGIVHLIIDHIKKKAT